MSVSLLMCNSSKSKSVVRSESECIKTVIKIDDSLGTVRNHACETISLSETIHNYTYSIEQIDFTYCPKDFETAFKTHAEAWKNMTVLTDKYPNLRSEMHVLFDSIAQGKDSLQFKPLLDEIWSSWSVIEDIMKPKTQEE